MSAKQNRPGVGTEAIEVLAGGLNYTDSTAETNAAVYFNLPAADRVVKRARARGDKAELVLVRLVPVDARQLESPGEASK